MNASNKKVLNGTKQIFPYSLPLDKINRYCPSSSCLGGISGVDEYAAISVSIDIMFTQDNDVSH